MPVVDPTLEGALIGAGATAVGGLITWFGAKSQSNAALKAVVLQAKGQRSDALWQMRRDAYAAFVESVERTRVAMAHVDAVLEMAGQLPDDLTPEDLNFDSPQAARRALTPQLKEMWHQQSILRLSVSETEASSAESLVQLLNGVCRHLDAWMQDQLAAGPDVEGLKGTFRQREGELRDSIKHFIRGAQGYLAFTPELDPSASSLWYRFRAWRLDRSFRSLDR